MDAADQKIRDAVQSLENAYLELQYDDSDSGASKRAEIRARLRRLTHDQIHPGEGDVELDMPVSVTGEPFMINEIPYVGRCVVPACVAQTLLYMLDQNRAVDLNRMKESGKTSIIGTIANLARSA